MAVVGGGLSTSIVSSGWGWESGSWGRVVGMGEEGGGFCCLAVLCSISEGSEGEGEDVINLSGQESFCCTTWLEKLPFLCLRRDC